MHLVQFLNSIVTVVSKTNHDTVQGFTVLCWSASVRQIAAPGIVLLSHFVDEETEDEEEL